MQRIERRFVTESSRFQFCPLAFFASSARNPNPKISSRKARKERKELWNG